MPDNGLNPQWSQVNFACAVWSPEQTLLKVSISTTRRAVLTQTPTLALTLTLTLTLTPTLLKVSIYNSKSSLLGKGSKVLPSYHPNPDPTPMNRPRSRVTCLPSLTTPTLGAARLRDGAGVRAA